MNDKKRKFIRVILLAVLFILVGCTKTNSTPTTATTYKTTPVATTPALTTPEPTPTHTVTPTSVPATTPISTPIPTSVPATTSTPAPTTTSAPTRTTTPTPGSMPSLSIIYPAPGAYEIVFNERIVVSVSNFNLVDKIGQANVPGEGHLIYYLDVQPPTTPGQPALTAQGTYAVSANTSYLWTSTFAGEHTLSVQLVNNDNTPLSPPVTASIKMNVNT